MDGVTEYLENSRKDNNFGNWTDIIDTLDPFRDGKAAYRIGSYINWLIEGYEQGLGKEIIMADAAERYCKEWGTDKVISI